ncbi:MAG TPA: ribonuclease H-like domain-containing protein [Candidatus Nanoarchaeia archaeon]|nr:ribonuclease H-like domain-containing protein [Candidatus Nanoarchaeia archaeon]
MIKNSFIFINGITARREEKLWSSGIKTWEDFLNTKNIKGIPEKNKIAYDEQIINAKKLYFSNDAALYKKFPSKEVWRLYNYLKDEAIFLDIEVGKNYKDIIIIGLFDGINTKTIVKSYNLDNNILLNELKKYKLLITYNGSAFDIPALEKFFNIKIEIPHLDLKHSCLKLGLKGGLKEIEKLLNIKRPSNLYGKPYDAYKAFMASGDKEYLELLIKYNEEDTINLKFIADYCYKILKERTDKLLM